VWTLQKFIDVAATQYVGGPRKVHMSLKSSQSSLGPVYVPIHSAMVE
jgi:hypothetical protein